jgi:predicted membrane-bound dolichyl-phosphate-mannose-protein mannosyltransferase
MARARATARFVGRQIMASLKRILIWSVIALAVSIPLDAALRITFREIAWSAYWIMSLIAGCII